MGTVIDLIQRHASVRRYSTDPVPKETIEAIIGAAQKASTSSNLQMYSAVAVTDAEKRVQLASLCGQQSFIAEAPVFLAWCADLSRLDRACELRSYTQVTRYVENFLTAAMDAAIVAQTAALAAESLGLGICYVGAIRNNPEGVVRLLHLPRLVFPIAGMTVGWPAVVPSKKPRLPLSSVLKWEAYDRSSVDADLLAYDQAMIATGVYEGRQLHLPGKAEIMEDYGWMEHSARRVSQPVREGLRKVLQDQGFQLE
jgi:FMN reductase (NADPH)